MQAPLRTTVSIFESLEDSSSQTSCLFFLRGGTPVRSCCGKRVLGLFLALDASWLHFPCCTLKRECVVQLLTGNTFDNDDVPFPSKAKTHRALFPIQIYPSISRGMGAQDVVRGHSTEDVPAVARSLDSTTLYSSLSTSRGPGNHGWIPVVSQ